MAVYKQLVAPRRGTEDGAGWCLRYAQSFFGAPVAHPSAWAAWNATARKQGVGTPLPTGAAVLVWFSHWGTYGGVYANWGHVAIYIAGEGIYTSPIAGWGRGIYGSIAEIERTFNAKYVGWTDNINTLRVAEPMALEPNQRQAYPGGRENDVKRREQPTTKSRDLGDPILAGTVGTFNGWIHGESVSGNNVWFRGATSGNWFWSGAFTNSSTTGLTDLNPVPPKPPVDPTQRKVDPEKPLRVRTLPSTGAKIVKELAINTVVTVEGWVTGEKVEDVNTWFKTSGGYAWAKGFTDLSTNGLKDLNPVKPPEPEPEPEPEEPAYVDFEAFSSVVTQVLPAHTNNYEFGRFPLDQDGVVLHDYGTDGRDTFEGTKSWFRNATANASAHFVVSGQNIVQMVSLKDRAYHAGPLGNENVGVEIDPVVGQADDTLTPERLKLKRDTIASVKKLLTALALHYKRVLTKFKHDMFMKTNCGDDINLIEYVIDDPNIPAPGDDDAPKWFVNFITALGDFFKSFFSKK